jgi:hypothetical protein
MKQIIKLFHAIFLLLVAYVTVWGITKNQMAASAVTVGLGAFSALMYRPLNRRERRAFARKGLAFTSIVIPDFTEKSVKEIEKFVEDTKKAFKAKTPEEIEKMSTEELIAYKKDEHEYNTALLKADYAIELKKAMEGTASKEQISEMQNKMDLVIKELERQGLAWKAMTEKPGAIEQAKSDFIQLIEKKAEDAKKRDNTGMGSVEFSAKTLFDGTVNKAAALMTTANVVPNVAGGFNQLFGNYMDQVIHAVPKPKNFILSLVDVTTQPGTEIIWYDQRINEEGDAAFIAEGALKPLVDGEYKEFSAPIKEVAARWKMSNRVMMHAPRVVSNFREHAEELVEQKMDSGVLTGDGTGNNLSGIATLASPFVAPTQLAGYYTDPNIWDVVNAVASYVALNNFEGNLTVVLNTVWKAMMAGIKDAEGRYLVPPFVTPDGKTISGVEVVFANKMPAGKILLGDLKRFKVVIAENIIFAEGWENDDFSKNLTSFKLEAFMGTYFPSNYAGAIIYDDIDTVLSAIDAAP